jgi:hypothetical protein
MFTIVSLPVYFFSTPSSITKSLSSIKQRPFCNSLLGIL